MLRHVSMCLRTIKGQHLKENGTLSKLPCLHGGDSDLQHDVQALSFQNPPQPAATQPQPSGRVTHTRHKGAFIAQQSGNPQITPAATGTGVADTSARPSRFFRSLEHSAACRAEAA